MHMAFTYKHLKSTFDATSPSTFEDLVELCIRSQAHPNAQCTRSHAKFLLQRTLTTAEHEFITNKFNGL